MSDAREALVALIPPPRAPEHVAHWPRDERDYYRHGDFADWSERLEVLDRMRREKVADAILAAGWTPPGERVKPTVEVGVCEHQNANYLRMMSERDALRAEVERLREGAGRALVDRDAYRAELDEARQQLADLLGFVRDVRAMHVSSSESRGVGRVDPETGEWGAYCDGDGEWWPCPTVQALTKRLGGEG